MAVLEPPGEDDGYVSPGFDLSSGSEDERLPTPKRPRTMVTSKSMDSPKATGLNRLAADEELALKLLEEGS